MTRETWFISDTHFGHQNILQYEKESRPFESVEEMNESIIDRWNRVVSDDDTVYHLGDFAFGRKNIAIAERLKGKKILILGNHDSYPLSEYSQYFNRIYGAFYFKNCLLTHIPVHQYNLISHFRSYGIEVGKMINVHGHLHSRRIMVPLLEKREELPFVTFSEFMEDPRYFNVSCEQNDLTPINYDVIKERLDEL